MSARNLSVAMAAAIAAGTVRPALLFEGLFATVSGGTDYLRLWTGIGTLSWNGYSWVGAGNLISVSPLSESQGVRAIGFSVSLSGMPSELIAIALNYGRQGYSGKIYLALFDANGAVIADPYQLQSGRFDVAVVDADGGKCSITAQYEGRLIDLERPRVRRYTHEDQQIDYPGDKGFEFVPGLQIKDIVWGGA